MRVCIHRGTHEIGGTCVEIEAHGKRIIVDIGLPLDADTAETPLPPVSGFTEPDSSLLGVIISHPHLDHYGLVQKLPQSIPILIGPAARKIIEAASLFIPHEVAFHETIALKDRIPITLGPFTITPFLVDHSAYDAYAILIEADEQRLFYSGDFRTHGRKGKLFERFVAHPPTDINVLLMEGTTIGRMEVEGVYPTESEIEEQFVEALGKTEGMALLWSSAQNIDRIVTAFRACKRSRRLFIMDMYTALVLRAIGNPRLPQAEWDVIRVYLPWTQKQTIIKKGLFDLSKSFSQWRIYPEELRRKAGTSMMLFRPSMIRDLENARCLECAVKLPFLVPS